MHRIAMILAALSACWVLAGCATPDPDAVSDIPWNAPQPWEGAPSIPGLETR